MILALLPFVVLYCCFLTGMKRTSLRFLEEQQVYSLNQKERTTKLFVLQFDQTVNSNLKEVSLQHLINRFVFSTV
jgi:hypothetical protein